MTQNVDYPLFSNPVGRHFNYGGPHGLSTWTPFYMMRLHRMEHPMLGGAISLQALIMQLGELAWVNVDSKHVQIAGAKTWQPMSDLWDGPKRERYLTDDVWAEECQRIRKLFSDLR